MVIKNVSLDIVCGITSKIPDTGRPEVAFAGKSNVGKSSLINGLMNRKALARTSAQPGKTQTINFYKHEEDDGVENKQQPDANRGEIRDNQSQSNDSKETMVAEPNPLYSNKSNSARIRLGGY